MSGSIQRKVQGYLKPSQHNFIKKYSEVYNMSESQAINQAVRCLQDTTPKDIRDRIMSMKSVSSASSKNSY